MTDFVFILSKIAWAFLAPTNLMLVLLLLSTALLLLGRRRTGTKLLAGTMTVLLLLATVPLSTWALASLEDRFPRPATLPAEIDGIIVLGGSVKPAASRHFGLPQLNGNAERMTVLPGLMARHPDARVVFTGGSGHVLNQTDLEAGVARQLWQEMGVDLSRVTFEDRARNTWENALFSKELMQPRPGENWLLVTSAAHMPRSVGIFRKVGWPVIAYPVDYQQAVPGERWPRFDLFMGLAELTMAVHEYVGTLSYWMLGRTDSVFPVPETGP